MNFNRYSYSRSYLAIVEADLHAARLDNEDLDRTERNQVGIGRHRLLEGPRGVLTRVQTCEVHTNENIRDR